MRVLVIGCGFLGGRIASGLASRGFGVTVLSRSFAPTLSAVRGRVTVIAADARDRAVLRHALQGIEEVVYCVGGLQPAAAQCNPELDRRLMLEPLCALLAILRRRPSVGVTYLSSGGAIYGNPRRLPVDELQPPAPIGAYAAVRLAGERLLAAARGPVRILRCSNVYGEEQPLDRGQGAVGVFVDRIARGQPIELFGDGQTIRDYFYVGDLVEVVARLLQPRRRSLLVNVGSGVGTSLLDLIELAEHELEHRAIVVRRPARPFDVRRVVLDVSRLRQLVDLETLPIAAGVELMAGRRHEPAFDVSSCGRDERVPAAVL